MNTTTARVTYPGAMDAALDIIRAAAAQRVPFSANDVRVAMDGAGVPSMVRGMAFLYARQTGIIERLGVIPSTQRETKGKPVLRYIAASLVQQPELRARPQARDDAGRWCRPGQDPLPLPLTPPEET